MKSRPLFAALGLALVIAGVVLFLVVRSSKTKAKAAASGSAQTENPEPGRDFATTRGPRSDEAHRDNPSSASPTASRMDRRHADEVREKLHTLFADAGLAWGTAPVAEVEAGTPPEIRMMPGPGSDGGPQELHKYIKDRMHEDFFPMAERCYLNALAKTPNLRGRIVLNYRIVGDKRVGGVVDTSELGEGTDIQDKGFNECMQQSMLSVTFDAPPEGTKELSVSYPIEFSPDDEDGG